MARDREEREHSRDREKRHKGDSKRRHKDKHREVAEDGKKRGRDEVEERGRKHRSASKDRSGHTSSRHKRDHDRDRDRERDKERTRDRGHERDREERQDGHRDKRRRSENLSSEQQEAQQKEKREAEMAELDDEMEKRRQRMKAWQESRNKAKAAEEAAKEAEEAQAAKWSLEDDFEEDEGGGPGPSRALRKPLQEGSDEVDPLEAFMNQNAESLHPPARKISGDMEMKQADAAAEPAADEEEIDPLDAYMDAQVMPEMRQARARTYAPAAADPDVKPEPKDEPMDTLEGAGSVPLPTSNDALPPVTATVVGVAGTPLRPLANGAAARAAPEGASGAKPQRARRRPLNSDSDDSSDEEYDSEEDDEAWAKAVQAGKLSKGDRLVPVDHSKINYLPFRRNFYIEVPELARMSEKEVAELRKQLEDVKVRGKDIPKPIRNWNQCGLRSSILETLRKDGFTGPMPIQAQALPAIMSGRDVIGIAKTGSGKTLAYVLPALRHIKDQPPLAQGDGPVALVMAPTRELVQQIGKDVRRFCRPLNMSCACVYGGSGVANQITELKRGVEVVVCTPGRMIDILVTSGGKITNMRRVTYLVLDEADRMFDMGFEPQIMRITSNIRPDRQTVMFSATFPRQVEVLAKSVLQNPVEIQVGGRSVVNKDIDQYVEIRPEEERFLRLLEILGEWYEKGKILIFVSSQEQCDNLFRDLLKVGYPCLSLHGGKDQSDRESTINDFKQDVCNLLVATSIAARGLDVKELVLVVNYDTPNHHEDYVHRVGRTGRAGNKGTAITFISEEEDKYAPDLVKALTESGVPIPADLQALAASFAAKRKAGTAQAHGSGFGGTGFKFDTNEEETRRQARRLTAKEYGGGHDSPVGSDNEDDEAITRAPPPGFRGAGDVTMAKPDVDLGPEALAQIKAAQELAKQMSQQAVAVGFRPSMSGMGQMEAPSAVVAAAQAAASQIAQKAGMPASAIQHPGVQRAAAFANSFGFGGMDDPDKPHFESRLDINDFPQHSRWKVTHKDSMAAINELTGAAVTTKGRYYKAGTQLPEGEQRLFLLIEGPTELSVKKAKDEIKRILEETTEKVFRRDGPSTGRYSIM